MSEQDEKAKAARMMLEETTLPERGGIYWFMGGVPPKQLPKPCAECVRFIAQMTDGELTRLMERAKQHDG